MPRQGKPRAARRDEGACRARTDARPAGPAAAACARPCRAQESGRTHRRLRYRLMPAILPELAGLALSCDAAHGERTARHHGCIAALCRVRAQAPTVTNVTPLALNRASNSMKSGPPRIGHGHLRMPGRMGSVPRHSTAATHARAAGAMGRRGLPVAPAGCRCATKRLLA